MIDVSTSSQKWTYLPLLLLLLPPLLPLPPPLSLENLFFHHSFSPPLPPLSTPSGRGETLEKLFVPTKFFFFFFDPRLNGNAIFKSNPPPWLFSPLRVLTIFTLLSSLLTPLDGFLAKTFSSSTKRSSSDCALIGCSTISLSESS